MKISVVIPTHNRQEKLTETIENLRRQNFPAEDFEIVVVHNLGFLVGVEVMMLIRNDYFLLLPRGRDLDGIRSVVGRCALENERDFLH